MNAYEKEGKKGKVWYVGNRGWIERELANEEGIKKRVDKRLGIRGYWNRIRNRRIKNE